MVCVIGAGFTGLAAALEFAESGVEVAVLEQSPAPGGIAADFYFDGSNEPIELIYHHIFTSDKHAADFAEKLAPGSMKWLKPNNSMIMGGKIYPFTSPLDLVMFKPLPFFDRIRTGLAVLKAGRIRDWKTLEKSYAREWLIKNVGKSGYEKMWRPLLASKFDADADNVSAVWIWNKFKLRGGSRAKGISKELLGYFDGGYGRLARLAAERIEKLGGKIIYGARATDIAQKGAGFLVSYEYKSEKCTIYADGLIAAIACKPFLELAQGLELAPSYIEKLASVKYKANICVALRLKHKLTDSYWITVCDERPFVAIIEHTNLVGDRGYGGSVVYLSRYLDMSDPLYSKSDEEIADIFISALSDMFPHFKRDAVTGVRVTKTDYSQPVVGLDYSDAMPPMATPINGLLLAGMAQIYPEDRGVNYAIGLGVTAAKELQRQIDAAD